MDKQELIDSIQQTDLCCHSCGSINVVKRGKSNGLQRYWCKDCNKTFNLASKTAMAWTRLETDKYLKYLELMEYQVPIRKAAKICGISMKTSFAWRHKFLESLTQKANNERLDSIVEADGTFVNLSFKGSRVLPREPHKRGNDVKLRGISNEKVCINTAIAREGRPDMANVIAVPTNLGPENTKAVREVFSERICLKEDTILCTDKKVCYKNVAQENNWNILMFDSRKRDYKGFYNLSRINAYHQLLKDFLRPTKGVATKYLSNYINWCNYLNRCNVNFSLQILTAINEARVTKIMDRPAIPFKTKYDKLIKTEGIFIIRKQIQDEKDIRLK